MRVRMAKLVIKSEGFKNQVLELRLGTNKLGRAAGNDFQIEHPTISANHCEIELRDDGVLVRDCNSTNGTFVGERPVKQASLWAGQVLRVGDVELLVESTDVTISIPKTTTTRPAPPIVLDDGAMLCPRHKNAKVTHQCTHCLQILCDQCLHRVRRRGGKVLKLCPECSHVCEPLLKPTRKKKNILGFLARTVKIPFVTKKEKEEV
jgi:pSer/pThr/pTyr-binding forkhead associated (FHA) protein